MMCSIILFLLFFKQKTAYEMRISDWSSDVCASDLIATHGIHQCLIDCGELIDTLQHQLRQSHEGLTCIGKEALRLGCTVKRLRDRDGPASVRGTYQPDPATHRRFQIGRAHV